MRRDAFKKAYLVTTVPWYLYPPYILVHVLIGVLSAGYYTLVYLTSSIIIEGIDHRKGDTPAIFVYWHEYAIIGFCTGLLKRKMEILNHPYWYMKHIHICIWLLGIRKLYLGSTGAGGRDAAEALTHSMNADPTLSSAMNLDGPEGPLHYVRKGAFHLAKDTGRPIVAVQHEVWPAIRLGGWDRKFVPLPFSTIYLKFHPAHPVTAANFANVVQQVEEELNRPIFGGKFASRGIFEAPAARNAGAQD